MVASCIPLVMRSHARRSGLLCQLSEDEFDTDLYISTIRAEDQGGLSLPAEVVAAAGELLTNSPGSPPL